MDTSTGAQKDPLYYLYDGLGSVVQLTDSTGKVADKYSYDEFGNQQPGGKQSPNASNVLHNDFGYTGEQWDSEAGLQYLRARYYDPEIGRFINRDSLIGNKLNPLSQNRYAYTRNNPVNYIDPSGHWPKWLDNVLDSVSDLFSDDDDEPGYDMPSGDYNTVLTPFSDAESDSDNNTSLNSGNSASGGGQGAASSVNSNNPSKTKCKDWRDMTEEELRNSVYNDAAMPFPIFDDPIFNSILFLDGMGEIKAALSGAKIGIKGLAKKIAGFFGSKEAANLFKKLSASELKSIGVASKSYGIRLVNGTVDDAYKFFKAQVDPSTIREYERGVLVGWDANGLKFSYRSWSKSGPPTIDITGVSGLRKIKFISE